MSNNISKAQFNRLAAIVNDSFGIADEDGRVMFSVPERLWENGQLDLTESDFMEENIFTKDGFCFYRCRPKESVIYIFKRTDTDVTCTVRMLRLMAYALEVAEDHGKNPIVFYRNLLTSGPSGVSTAEIKDYEVPRLMGYLALSVSSDIKEGAGEEDLIKELLLNLFPSDQGYFTVPMSTGKFAVVCPVQSEEMISEIKSVAGLIYDTAVAEIMITVRVAIGTVKSKLSELNQSYEEALKAAEIGTLFELPHSCYSYNELGIHRLVFEMKPATCIQFLRETLGSEFFRDKNGPELLSSLRAFLDNNMNISEASKALYIHRNTLLYRMDKFKKLTGLDAANFEDGVRIRIALMVIKYLEKTAPEDLLGYIAFYRKK